MSAATSARAAFTEAALQTWRSTPGDEVPSAAHDAAAIAFGVYSDVLANPALYAAAYNATTPSASTWPVRSMGANEPIIGISTESTRPADRAAELSAAIERGDTREVERLRYVLAMQSALGELADATAGGVPLRGAGLGIPAAIAICVGAVALAVVGTEVAITVRERARAELRALELAGEAAARRYARAAQTGTLDAPTPVETAAQETVHQRSESELQRLGKGATDLAIAAAVVVALYLVVQSQKGR